LSFDDRPNDPAHPAIADGCWTSTGYFSAIGAPLLQGRLFADRDDAQAAPIVIVNRSLAQKFWPGENPVGKRIAVNYLGMGRRNTGTVRYREVVGVVGDFKQRALDVPTAPTLYMPFHQDETHHDYSGLNLLVRTAGDPRGAAGSLRTAIHSVRPDQAVGDMFTLSDVLAKGLAPRRFSLLLLGSFAALALALSAIGIYGTIAYSVGQRRREMGVRAAVGASAGDLLIMVMKEGLALIVAGLAMGFALSFFFSRAMSAMLFGISAADAVTLVSSGLLLLAVAAAACFVPARRAASADPMLALRAE
jgi:putative ABC transport system permease protein